jgi:ribose transport system permease protein
MPRDLATLQRLRDSLLVDARKLVAGGPVTAAVFLLALIIATNEYLPMFNSFQWLLMSNNTTVLAFAAIGETLVVLSGGFDLSVAGVLSLVNVTLTQELAGGTGHQVAIALAGIGIGAAAGLMNGFFVAVVGIQPIVVTIASLFVLDGLALAVMGQPGGSTPTGFSTFLTTDVGGWPRSFLIICGAAAIWVVLRRTRYGRRLYAVGSDAGAARLSGVPVRRVLLATYAIAGAFYGAAGVFLTAQIASGDPGIGSSYLLIAFVAVVLGGVRFGGGYGTAIGSIIGAFTVTMVDNLLVAASVSSYYTQILEGMLLVIAVVLSVAVRRLRVKRPVLART